VVRAPPVGGESRAPLVADKKHLRRGPAMAERAVQGQADSKECPKCGARARLYRTPRGLRCAECVKQMDSAGLGFR